MYDVGAETVARPQKEVLKKEAKVECASLYQSIKN